AGAAAPAAGARGPVGDWLLAIAVGVARPAPDPSRVVRLAWDHANRTLLKLVLQAKEVVLAQIMACLQRLISRLELLGDYYGRWAATMPELESEEYRLSAEEQQYVLLDRERLDEFSDLRTLRLDLQTSPLYRRLTAQVVRGLPPVDDEGHPPLDAEGREDIFVGSLPRDRRSNEVDFSYLHEIERSIFDSIGSRSNGPYQMEVIDLLQRQAQRDRVQLANFAAEGAPLLQFNAGDQYYRRDCPFGDSVDYWAVLVDQNSVGVAPFLTVVRAGNAAYQFPDRPAAVRETDSHIPSVFTEVRSRGGVVSTLIAGYDATAARGLIENAIVPPLVDSRIRPPLDPELLFKAGVRLLGGALLGPKVVLNVAEQETGFEFLYQLQVGRMLSQQSRHFSSDFGEAQSLLATLPIELEQIDLSIKGRTQTDRDGVSERITKVSQMINDHLVGNHPDCQAKRLDIWGDLEKPSGVYFENLEYGNAFSLLSSFVIEYNLDCTLEMTHNHAVFKRAGDPLANGGTAQVAGFYCKFGPRCGTYLGSTLPSNNHPCRVCNNTGVPQG
ncbi:MAG: hypothetical protein HYU66_28470, partial [Armatimonadetes bacterium]|nr:hypothetical protein [Armatimonadota bacterium]